MRLIDADMCPALFDAEFKETKRLILDGENHLDNLAEGFMEAHNVIRSMPTIDAVPIVRCKDCKYYNRNLGEEKKTCIYLAYTTHALEEECRVGEDDFCSHAEKKS